MTGITVKVGGGKLFLDKKLVRATLRAAGSEVAAVARSMIRAGGKKRVSKPGQPPVNRTGKLASDIKVKLFRSGEGVSIIDFAAKGGAFYGRFLELGAKGGVGSGKKGVRGKRNQRSKRNGVTVVGTRVLLPRPFLSAALDQREASITARIAQAINQGVKFQKMKAKP